MPLLPFPWYPALRRHFRYDLLRSCLGWPPGSGNTGRCRALPQLMTFFNLADQFVDRHIREGRASKIAIRCGESIRTYGEVASDVNRIGNALLNLGLRQGRRVLLLLQDCPEVAAA